MTAFPPKPDYSLDCCWAAKAGGKKQFNIFYLYPTFYQGPAGTLVDVYVAEHLLPFIKKNIIKNCGIFCGLGNIYAPLYRQASFSSLHLPEKEKRKLLKTSLSDAESAFNYFREHFGDKPFVLAGHSQGSRLLRELIKKRFKDKALRTKLIAAYLIGAEVTKCDLLKYPWLKLAKEAGDTSVVITYNTQGLGVKRTPIFEHGGAVSVNPLNWGQKPASKNLNKGAVFFDREGRPARVIKNFTGAYIDASGALIAPDADEEAYSLRIFPKSVYHIYDYEFFYKNLQSNFKKRLKNYEAKLRP
jgi:hypothetical protein